VIDDQNQKGDWKRLLGLEGSFYWQVP